MNSITSTSVKVIISDSHKLSFTIYFSQSCYFPALLKVFWLYAMYMELCCCSNRCCNPASFIWNLWGGPFEKNSWQVKSSATHLWNSSTQEKIKTLNMHAEGVQHWSLYERRSGSEAPSQHVRDPRGKPVVAQAVLALFPQCQAPGRVAELSFL